MNLYSIDVMLCATAYIKAESEEAALEIAKQEFGKDCCGELPTGEYAETPVSGKQYDNPDLPDVSLSPAVTFYGPANEGDPLMELVEENIDEEEEEET